MTPSVSTVRRSDSTNFTGSQLSDAKAALLAKKPSEVRTACFYVTDSSTEYPDYYYKATRGPIKVPWRVLKEYKRTSKMGLLTKDI